MTNRLPTQRQSADLHQSGYMPVGELRWSRRRVIEQPAEPSLGGAPLLKVSYTHVLQQLWTHPEPMKGQYWQDVPAVEYKVEE